MPNISHPNQIFFLPFFFFFRTPQPNIYLSLPLSLCFLRIYISTIFIFLGHRNRKLFCNSFQQGAPSTMSFPLTLSSLMTLFPYILLFTFFFPFCYNMNLPNPASSTTTTPLKKPTTFPTPLTTTTIPAFPDQSNVEGCPITLSDELLNGIKSACSVVDGAVANTELHRSRCCPVLAAWLYYAYSSTSLGKLNHSHNRGHGHDHGHATSSSSLYEDMPLMPDDSETCVNGLGKALEVRGVELRKPNETCDVVYCYCGIRLHPFSCNDAFSVTQSGELVGDESVRRLEKDCLSSSGRSRSTSGVNGFPGLGGCSKCLNSLYLVSFHYKKAIFLAFFCLYIVVDMGMCQF